MNSSRAAFRLEPDAMAPGHARRIVADALSAPGLEEVRVVATLLVSELVTNSVVHAASAVELFVEPEPDAVVVRVRDADTGPLVIRGGGSELDEGGRGFVLVDRLSDAWGTEHHGGRKTVWFRVSTAAAKPAVAGGPAGDAAPVEGPPPRETAVQASLARLLVTPATVHALTFEEHAGELLARVLETLPASGAELRLAVGDRRSVVCGSVDAPVLASCELVIDDRTLGKLELHGAATLDADSRAFARLAADRLALLVAEHGFVEDARASSRGLDFLAEATELLTRSLNVSLSLALITQIVVPRLADWCATYTVDERRRPRRLTVNHRTEERADAVADLLDRDVEVMQAVTAVADGGPSQRLPLSVFVAGERSHVTVLSLQSRGRTLGVLVLGRVLALDPVEYVAALELARRAALAVDNARLHESQAATVNALQSSLLPPALPVVPGVLLGARYHSASPGMSVGGDFYDAFALADGSFAVAIGDVCGKGAEAAAVTGMTRDLLRVLVQDGASPAAALRRLNRALLEHPTSSRFCTVALAVVTPVGPALQVRLCLAGHPEPVLVEPGGTSRLVGTPGDLLGVLADDELGLAEVDVEVARGGSLVFYTDGVAERRDGTRMFGQFGIRRTLTEAAGVSADALAHRLEQAARSFVDTDLRDDLAILVVQPLSDVPEADTTVRSAADRRGAPEPAGGASAAAASPA